MGKAPARAESNNVLGHTRETKCVEPCSSFYEGSMTGMKYVRLHCTHRKN